MDILLAITLLVGLGFMVLLVVALGRRPAALVLWYPVSPAGIAFLRTIDAHRQQDALTNPIEPTLQRQWIKS